MSSHYFDLEDGWCHYHRRFCNMAQERAEDYSDGWAE